MVSERGQAYTLEGFVGAMIVLTAMLFALQSVVLTPTTAGTVDQSVKTQLRTQTNDLLRTAGSDGTLDDVVLYWNATIGYAIVHDNRSTSFLGDDGRENWTVARNADPRQHVLTVDPGNDTSASDGFRLSVTDGSDRWNLTTYRQDGNVSVRTNGTTVAPSTCPDVTAGNLTIDLRNGTTTPGSCTFDYASGLVGPYGVAYLNGDNATGTYSVVLNGTAATLPAVNTTASVSPYRTFVAYEVEATFSYVTPDSTYRGRTNATLYEP